MSYLSGGSLVGKMKREKMDFMSVMPKLKITKGAAKCMNKIEDSKELAVNANNKHKDPLLHKERRAAKEETIKKYETELLHKEHRSISEIKDYRRNHLFDNIDYDRKRYLQVKFVGNV
eukprot:TRINITY_DN13918_c0_g1_i9.p2 TRINITY_DN13918_c0_g1~~TRINITY_DN13918_c0_g1_i9.p2  ORF type:complete len:118 (+),score=12.29 TRINITY_DN13918_c0_g1_i9:377-730(+)